MPVNVKTVVKETARRATAVVAAAVLAPAAKRKNSRRTISRAAALAGVNVETVRFYEREGLIEKPARPAQGYRAYPLATVRRIQLLRHCQELGFTLREARELAALHDCRDACARVSRKIKQLDEKIAALHHLRDDLQLLLSRRPSGVCGVMETLNAYAEAAAVPRNELRSALTLS